VATEFELIARYFTRPVSRAVLGVGDDAAIIEVPNGRQLAVTTDTLVAGTHFFHDAEPEPLGHKSLAVNLSDLAAMGAQPRYALLALTLPASDERWVAQFADGFLRLADGCDVELIGGDTSQGPLSITVTVLGELPKGRALTRAGARPGDDVWVSGVLGEAALAVRHLKGELRLKGPDLDHCLRRLHQPTPRVKLGERLLDVATAAIDISDGLVADLAHICERSGMSAEVEFERVPCHPKVMPLKGLPAVRDAVLAGGDDYELLFTAPTARRRDVAEISAATSVGITSIGRIVAGTGVRVTDGLGRKVELPSKGYEHFR
jgi:thiamine-monophosphate kinase